MPVGCVQLMCSSPALASILYCGGDIWQAFCFEAQPNHVIALQVIDCSLESHWKSFQFPVELYLTVWLRRIFLFVFLYFFFFLISWAQDESQSSELEDQSPKQNQVLAVSNSLAVRMPIYLSSFIYLPPICLLNRSVAQIVLELNLTFLTQLPRHLDYRHGLSAMPG